MLKILITNAQIVNESEIISGAIIIENEYIKEIIENEKIQNKEEYQVIDAQNNYVLPGIIDTHVHFREPGLIAKGDIYTESRAAAAGGVTSFFEMPNTIPPTIDIKSLNQKFEIAQSYSLINYSFYIAATNYNLKEIKKTDFQNVAGIKLFFGSSTGNMLVDDNKTIEKIFRLNLAPIAVHSEMDSIIKRNIEHLKKVGIELQAYHHPRIRSTQACIEATKQLLDLAIKNNTKLHFLHISTKEEVDYVSKININRSLITFETSPNYLFFDSNDYQKLGMKIKCNPAIKSPEDKIALIDALNDNIIDTIATDHAPHLEKEKQNSYDNAPSGIPSIQHSLILLLELVNQKRITINKVVEKMCSNPAKIFKIKQRGAIKAGYYADLTIVSLNEKTVVNKQNLLYKCGWSPLEGNVFNSKVLTTIVNGKIVYQNDKIIEQKAGKQLEFER